MFDLPYTQILCASYEVFARLISKQEVSWSYTFWLDLLTRKVKHLSKEGEKSDDQGSLRDLQVYNQEAVPHSMDIRCHRVSSAKDLYVPQNAAKEGLIHAYWNLCVCFDQTGSLHQHVVRLITQFGDSEQILIITETTPSGGMVLLLSVQRNRFVRISDKQGVDVGAQNDNAISFEHWIAPIQVEHHQGRHTRNDTSTYNQRVYTTLQFYK